MASLKIFTHNPFQENTYLIIGENKEAILVDPGSYSSKERNEIKYFIENQGLQLIRILLTHGHIDHILGAQWFSDQFHLPVECHPDEVKLIQKAEIQASAYGFNYDTISNLLPSLTEQTEIACGESILRFRHIPGHTEGSVGIYSGKDEWFLSGDVLFMGSIGRTDLPGGDYDILMKSILEKILCLPPDTQVYPGHGPSTTLLAEMMENPFITEFLRGIQ
jgi:hydroxyacylglutathione hydrolase